MRIPANALHWYVGWPFLFAIVVRGILVRKSSKNTTNQLLLVATTLFLTSTTFSGFTGIFTLDPHILSLGSTLGGVLEAIALIVVWVMVAHMYFPRNIALRLLLISASVLVATACIYISITENMAQLSTLTLNDGVWYLDYPFSTTYQAIIGILYSSFIFVAAKFWRQSSSATTSAQSWRLKGFAIGLFLIGTNFIVLPFIDTPRPLAAPQSILIGAGVMIMGSFLLGSLIFHHAKAHN